MVRSLMFVLLQTSALVARQIGPPTNQLLKIRTEPKVLLSDVTGKKSKICQKKLNILNNIFSNYMIFFDFIVVEIS